MTDTVGSHLRNTAKELLWLADKADQKAALLKTLSEEDNIFARLEAEAEVERLTRVNTAATEALNIGRVREASQRSKLENIRRTLNGGGKDLIDHAFDVFHALATSVPNHPLVNREPLEKAKLSLSRTELRLIYGCLESYVGRLSCDGCDDYRIVDPDEATVTFMRDMDRWEDPGDDDCWVSFDPKPDKHGCVWGAGSMTVVFYLQHLMKEVYGEDTFKGAGDLGPG